MNSNVGEIGFPFPGCSRSIRGRASATTVKQFLDLYSQLDSSNTRSEVIQTLLFLELNRTQDNNNGADNNWMFTLDRTMTLLNELSQSRDYISWIILKVLDLMVNERPEETDTQEWIDFMDIIGMRDIRYPFFEKPSNRLVDLLSTIFLLDQNREGILRLLYACVLGGATLRDSINKLDPEKFFRSNISGSSDYCQFSKGR